MKANAMNFKSKIICSRRNRLGMSMVEVVVAMGVLVLVGGALVALVLQAVAMSNSAKMRSIATRYAEEGMEIVRSIRGPQVDWVSFVDSCTPSPVNGYYITTGTTFHCDSGGILVSCDTFIPVSDCGSLEDNVGYAKFKRIIRIVASGSPTDSVSVTVTVSWKDQGKDRNIVLVSNLTKWK